MFVLALLASLCICKEQVLNQSNSLMDPFVDENGRSQSWKFYDNYVVKLQGDSRYIQLGYRAKNTGGAVMSTKAIGSIHFTLDFHFSVTSDKSRSTDHGICIWLSEEPVFNAGSCYGRSCDFQGLMVAMDYTTSKPFIGVKSGVISIGKGPREKAFDAILKTNEIVNHSFAVRITQDTTGIYIYLIDKTSKETLVHHVRNFFVNKHSKVGVTGSTTTGFLYRILGISSYTLKNIDSIYIQGETKTGGFYFYPIFIVVLGGIVYYLYTLHGKKSQ